MEIKAYIRPAKVAEVEIGHLTQVHVRSFGRTGLGVGPKHLESVWRSSPRFPARRGRGRSTPAPCIHRDCGRGAGAAEIVRDEPGSCPICGMALEPRTVTVEEEENLELADMRRRSWVSVALTVPLVLIAMAAYFPDEPMAGLASPELLGWVEMLLATSVVLWGGWSFFVRGWKLVATWILWASPSPTSTAWSRISSRRSSRRPWGTWPARWACTSRSRR